MSSIKNQKISITNEEEFIESVAAKCIAKLSEEDKKVLIDNPDPSVHHFGYGLYIRNKYLHGKNLPMSVQFYPKDDLSSMILERIIEILKEG